VSIRAYLACEKLLHCSGRSKPDRTHMRLLQQETKARQGVSGDSPRPRDEDALLKDPSTFRSSNSSRSLADGLPLRGQAEQAPYLFPCSTSKSHLARSLLRGVLSSYIKGPASSSNPDKEDNNPRRTKRQGLGVLGTLRHLADSGLCLPFQSLTS
jgi:hypothetical protein